MFYVQVYIKYFCNKGVFDAAETPVTIYFQPVAQKQSGKLNFYFFSTSTMFYVNYDKAINMK